MLGQSGKAEWRLLLNWTEAKLLGGCNPCTVPRQICHWANVACVRDPLAACLMLSPALSE